MADKLTHTCRLVRKAWRSGHQVVVLGQASDLARLDQQLWTFETGEFLPHLRLRPGQPPAPRQLVTPIWLVEQLSDAPACDVLVNISAQAVASPAAMLAPFGRVIDVVTEDPGEVAAGRNRWRSYKAAGLSPANVAVGAPEPEQPG